MEFMAEPDPLFSMMKRITGYSFGSLRDGVLKKVWLCVSDPRRGLQNAIQIAIFKDGLEDSLQFFGFNEDDSQ